MSEPDKKEDPPKAEPAKEPPKPALMEAPLLNVTGRATAILKPLMAMSAAGGVFIALLYFLRIGYLPVESLSSFAALSGAIVLVSAGLFVSVFGLWTLPAWLCLMARQSEIRDVWLLWFEAPRPLPQGGLNILLWRVFAAVMSTMGAAWLLLIGVPLVDAYADLGRWKLLIQGVIAAAAFAGAYWYAFGGIARFGSQWKYRGWRAVVTSVERLLGAVFYGLCGAFPLWIFVKLFQISQYRHSTSALAIALIFGIAFVVVIASNTLMLGMAAIPSVKQKEFAALSGGMAAYILVAGFAVLGVTGRMHDTVMSAVSVRINRAHLVLSKEACASMSQLGVRTAAVLDASGKTLETCVLPDVTVLSRLGDRWRLSCDPDEGASAVPGLDESAEDDRQKREGGSNAAVMLDAKSVLSWYELRTEAVSPRYGRRAICGDWGITPAAGELASSSPPSAAPPAATASGAKP